MKRTLTFVIFAMIFCTYSNIQAQAKGNVKVIFVEEKTGQEVTPRYKWNGLGDLVDCEYKAGCNFEVYSKVNDDEWQTEMRDIIHRGDERWMRETLKEAYLSLSCCGKRELDFSHIVFMSEGGTVYGCTKKTFKFEMPSYTTQNFGMLLLQVQVEKFVKVKFTNHISHDSGRLVLRTEGDWKKLCDNKRIPNKCWPTDDDANYAYIRPGKYNLSYKPDPSGCFIHGFNSSLDFDIPQCPENGNDLWVSYMAVGDALRMDVKEIPGSWEAPRVEFQLCEFSQILEAESSGVCPGFVHQRYEGETFEVIYEPGWMLYITAMDM